MKMDFLIAEIQTTPMNALLSQYLSIVTAKKPKKVKTFKTEVERKKII